MNNSSNTEIETLPRFVIIGSCGDGKSSIIKALIKEGEECPEAGWDADGITKDIRPYKTSNGMLLLDTIRC